MQTEDSKKYYVGQQEIIKADYPKEGFVQYTIEYPNMQGELEEITETIPVEQFEAIKSETPYPDGQVAPRQWKAALSEMMGVFLKHNVRMGDLQFLIPQLKASFDLRYEQATAKLWKRRHKDFVRLSQVDEMIKTDTEVLED